eukprot:1787495-Pyramimonas_sp.AAC.1
MLDGQTLDSAELRHDCFQPKVPDMQGLDLQDDEARAGFSYKGFCCSLCRSSSRCRCWSSGA